MDSIFNFLKNLKSKETKPKVYAAVVKIPQGKFLILKSGYSLEEAIVRWRQDMKKKAPGLNTDEITLELYNIADPESLFADFLGQEVQKKLEIKPAPEKTVDSVLPPGKIQKYAESFVEGKGTMTLEDFKKFLDGGPEGQASVSDERAKREELMKKIFETKDRALLEESKSTLSLAEYKYLKEKINPKKK